jgi:hypothetical protein
MEKLLDITQEFDSACQYCEAVSKLEQIGDPTLDNIAEIASIIQSVQFITEGGNWHFRDLIRSSAGAAVNSVVQGEINNLISYMSHIIITVPDPNDPGKYIDLYAGTLTDDGDGIHEHYKDGGGAPCSLWELATDMDLTLINNKWDAEGSQDDKNAAWENDPNLQGYDEKDGNPENWQYYYAAQGTYAQWKQYIHLDTRFADTAGEQAALKAFEGNFG